eukprot:Filipodium_phascolosomae@DN5958_c0_g1_i1.p1
MDTPIQLLQMEGSALTEVLLAARQRVFPPSPDKEKSKRSGDSEESDEKEPLFVQPAVVLNARVRVPSTDRVPLTARVKAWRDFYRETLGECRVWMLDLEAERFAVVVGKNSTESAAEMAARLGRLYDALAAEGNEEDQDQGLQWQPLPPNSDLLQSCLANPYESFTQDMHRLISACTWNELVAPLSLLLLSWPICHFFQFRGFLLVCFVMCISIICVSSPLHNRLLDTMGVM